MKIIILGAGQVGRTAAYHLSREEANDVTVIDLNEEILRDLQDRLDIRTVNGNASSPRILEAAGIASTDILVALTNSDEVNMLACQIAWTLYRTPKKIARVRSADYTERDKLFGENAVAVDVWISPEQLVTEYVARLIRYPGALQVLDFADGRVRLVGIRALQGGPLVGQALKTLREHIPSADARVAAIYRAGKSIKPEGTTVIEDGDEVFFLAARENIRVVMKEMRREERPARRVVIAGGGNIGFRLASELEDKNQVKLIERDSKRRARRVSEQLNRTIVLHGDAADEELLLEENIDSTDVFAALTNSEEANILSAMLAKRLGAHKVMALINKPSYAELIESGSIDVAISPQTVTIGSLLAHVRRGDVVRVHSLRRGAAEALEVVVHGDADSSKVIGRRIEDIALPEGTTLGAVVRGDDVIIAHHDTTVQPDDHLILFLTDRRHIDAVEKLFQGSASFLVKDILLPVAHVFAMVMMVFAVTMLAPLIMAVWELDPALWAFVTSAVATFVLGALLWLATRRFKRELKTRDGLMLVALTWVALPAVAGFPLWNYLPINFTDAYFEAASGLTTTGRDGAVRPRIPAALDQLMAPSAQLAWAAWASSCWPWPFCPCWVSAACRSTVPRCQVPMKDSKLTPRIGQTAKLLWAVYAGLTAACVVCLKLAGMNWFDAVCHGFSALALGGFSTYDASIGHFNSLPIEMVLTVFQILAALNFATHFLAWSQRGVLAYFRDAEAKAVLGVLFASCIGIALFLYLQGQLRRIFPPRCRHTTFNLVSIATDSGLHTQDYSRWPIFAPMWMMFLSCIVASSGSTGGGIKMIRTLVLAKQAHRELNMLVHPNMVRPLKVGGTVIANRVVFAVLAFVFLYFMSIVTLIFVQLASGLDFLTSLSSIIACINNAGPGSGIGGAG